MATSIDLLPVEVNVSIEQETDATLEFELRAYDTLLGQWLPEDLTADAVELTVRDDWGGTLKTNKANTVGQHSAPLSGKTRFRLTKTDLTTGDKTSDVKWKYEVRRIVGATQEEIVYIKGTLILAKTVGGY